jgi:ATP-dependent Lon protease
MHPNQRQNHGLEPGEWEVEHAALQGVIRRYTREAGVRSLEREIAKLARKAVKEILMGKKQAVTVTAENLEEYLGVPKFRYGEAELEDQVGVVTGLAWTEVGGEILVTEATLMSGKGHLTLTGKLGDVMQESAQAAMSYVRSKAEEFGIPKDFNKRTDVHIHVPEGAIPKDGPSAGITLATALVSALARVPIRKDVAMTGEITLRGKVLPIGGVKEKVLAAHRAGLKTIILPKDNEKDLADIPKNVLDTLDVYLVQTMDEVLKIALTEPLAGRLPAEAQAEPVDGAVVDDTITH